MKKPWRNIEKYYDIRGDGVARLNLKKAIKSNTFKRSVLKLSLFKPAQDRGGV